MLADLLLLKLSSDRNSSDKTTFHSISDDTFSFNVAHVFLMKYFFFCDGSFHSQDQGTLDMTQSLFMVRTSAVFKTV